MYIVELLEIQKWKVTCNLLYLTLPLLMNEALSFFILF